MLVTLWTIESGRFTRDVDYLAFVENNEANLKAIFTEVLSIDADDGLVFDTGKGRRFRSPLIWGLAMY